MNRDSGAAAPQGAYYDEGMKEWYRPSWKGRPEVVVGPEDRTGRQVTLVLDCWACRDREPHSQAYHDAQMGEELKRWGVRRVREDGAVWIVMTDQRVDDPAENGWDDDE